MGQHHQAVACLCWYNIDNMSKEKVAGYRVSYAQNREDIILAAFFEDVEKGFYVDVGANDPEIDSVTKYFYERGWNGINCEPQLGHFKLLQKERKRDINLNVGVGSKKGKLSLRQYKGDGLSTLSSDFKAEYANSPDDNTKTYVDTMVEVRTLASIFDEYKITVINFMKVDVEGYEYEVLYANNWNRYRPQVICIEADHVRIDWHDLLKDNDYKLVFFDGLNEYFVDDKNPEIEKRFSYVKSVLIGKPIAPRGLANVIYEQNNSLEANIKKIEQLQQEVVRISEHVHYLQNELDEVSSLRAHINKFVKNKLHLINDRIENKLQSKRVFQPVVPASSKDILTAAKDSDSNNIIAYNQNFMDNKKIRIYRKAKRLIKRILLGKKARL